MPSIVITAQKPRNPLVQAVRFRRAGSHRPSSRSARQDGRRELRHELGRLERPPSP